jgi:hypothetical protein
LLDVLAVYTNPPGLTDDEADEFMGPTWDLLTDLSTAPQLGVSLRETVEQAIPELVKAERGIAARAV